MATQVSSGLIENNAINDAHIANVALTGVTASGGDSSTSLATTAFVAGEINSLIDAAPGALNTLNELAAAMGDDANFSTTVTNSIATKLPISGGTMTGALTLSAASIILSDSGNNEQSVRIQNSTVSSYLGVEGSSANRFVGSAANNMFLGTTTSDGIEFATNNNVRAIIDSAGNVGIGELTPSSIFHVKTASGVHRSRFESGNSHSLIRLIAATGSNAGLEFYSGAGNVGNITADGSSNLLFEPGGAEKMRIQSGGNVGIGEQSPSAKLHVKEGDAGSITANTNFDQLILEDDQHSGMQIWSGTNYDGGIYFGDPVGASQGQFKYQHQYDRFVFVTNNGSGNALTINSDDSLSVNGDLTVTTQGNTATVFKVQNNSASGQGGIQLYGVDANHSIFLRRGNDGTLNTNDYHQYGTHRFFTGGALASQTERLRIDSTGAIYIGNLANWPASPAGRLLIHGGTGNGQNSGIHYRTGSYSEYTNIVTASTVASAHRYWHVKTNMPKTGGYMFKGNFRGYAYGNSGADIDVRITGYLYSATQSVINSVVNNIGTSTTSASTYFSSDNYLVFVLDQIGGYYTGCTFDLMQPSPAGAGHNFAVSANGFSTAATGLY